MHTESAYDGCTAYRYPEQGIVDRLLCVHIQSQRAFGPGWTLSYNMLLSMSTRDTCASFLCAVRVTQPLCWLSCLIAFV